jgi:hypothetical protein
VVDANQPAMMSDADRGVEVGVLFFCSVVLCGAYLAYSLQGIQMDRGIGEGTAMGRG